MQGTDLDWFRRLRAATPLEITAAGGITTMDEVRELTAMGVNCRPRYGHLYRPAQPGRPCTNGLIAASD